MIFTRRLFALCESVIISCPWLTLGRNFSCLSAGVLTLMPLASFFMWRVKRIPGGGSTVIDAIAADWSPAVRVKLSLGLVARFEKET